MSKRIWGVLASVFVLALIAVMAGWCFRQRTQTQPGEQRGTDLVELTPAETQPERVSVREERDSSSDPGMEEMKTAGAEGYQFLLVDDNNYVTVFKLPEEELYEYTDVILDVLPADLQEEIRAGKYLKSEAELYNFLENYTS